MSGLSAAAAAAAGSGTGAGSSTWLGKTVGILGGGQLGRMLAEAAFPLGIRACVLDPNGEDSSAGQVAHVAMKGDFKSAQEILSFVDRVNPDVLTVEIEHVNVDALVTVQQTRRISIQPSPQTIRVIQDKYHQKVHLRSAPAPAPAPVPVTVSWPLSSSYPLVLLGNTGFPWVGSRRRVARRRLPPLVRSLATLSCSSPGSWRMMAGATRLSRVLKVRQFCFGIAKSPPQSHRIFPLAPADIEKALAMLVSAEVYAEKWITFEKELAVIVVRGLDGKVTSYPVVETIQKVSELLLERGLDWGVTR